MKTPTTNPTGRRVLHWTVLGRDEHASDQWKRYWWIQCDCGEQRTVRSDRLMARPPHCRACKRRRPADWDPKAAKEERQRVAPREPAAAPVVRISVAFEAERSEFFRCRVCQHMTAPRVGQCATCGSVGSADVLEAVA